MVISVWRTVDREVDSAAQKISLQKQAGDPARRVTLQRADEQPVWEPHAFQ